MFRRISTTPSWVKSGSDEPHEKGKPLRGTGLKAKQARHIRARQAAGRRAFFDFLYLRSLDRDRQKARRLVQSIAKYPVGGIVPFHSSIRTYLLRPEDEKRLQEHLRSAIGRLVLDWSTRARDIRRPWWAPKLSVQGTYLRRSNDLLLQFAIVKPDWLRLVYVGLGILGEALPSLRNCALCGRMFFKIKQQACCSLSHASVVRARTRTAKMAQGCPQGRKKTDYRQGVQEQHNEWRVLEPPNLAPESDVLVRSHRAEHKRRSRRGTGSKSK